MAGALGVRLGGRNVYEGRAEVRPTMGDGRAPGVPDIRRANRISALVGTIAAIGAASGCLAAAWYAGRRSAARPATARRLASSRCRAGLVREEGVA